MSGDDYVLADLELTATPFFVTALAAAALKLLPVPVESMDKLLTAREPSVPLKKIGFENAFLRLTAVRRWLTR
jgi:hypothetical protein